MEDFQQILRTFSEFERGDSRLKRIREAIVLADQNNQLLWQFRFRYEYIEESVFCGDRYCAMIMFPEMLSLYEKNTSLQEDAYISHNLLFCFKWIVEAAPEFPNISREEIESYFRLFRKMLLQQGKSLSIFYMKRCLFYMQADPALAAVDFYRFRDAPLDDISDGKAFYQDQVAKYYLSIGEEEKALAAAEPIFTGKLTANSMPQITYGDFCEYYLNQKNYSEAMRYANMIEPKILNDPYYLDLLSVLLSLYSVTDVPHGMELFEKHKVFYENSRNPWLKMLFAIGAYHVLHSAGDERQEKLFQEVSEAVEKFDTRNGTTYYAKKLYRFNDEKGDF